MYLAFNLIEITGDRTMKTEQQIKEIMEQAEKEIQAVCSKLGVTIGAGDQSVLIVHLEAHENGDIRFNELELKTAPF